MEFLALIITVCSSAILLWWFRSASKKHKRKNLPPGPTPIPIVGNIFHVSKNPHHMFAEMSKRYGPLLSLHFGSVLNVVVSSPELAKEVLTKHGFAGRYATEAAQALDHHKLSMAFLPVRSRKWKDLRKISKEQIFAHPSLEASQPLRREKLRQLLRHVRECCDGGRAVDISSAAFTTTLNLMSATLFSAEATEFDSGRTQELKETLDAVVNISGVANVADFFPILKRFDPQSVKREAEVLYGKIFDLVRVYVDQRLEYRRSNRNAAKKNDFLETLVDIVLGNEYDMGFDDIVHLIPDLFSAGTETSASSIEWIMAELLLHPDKLSKAKAEVRAVMGDNDLINDSDIPKLPYLHAVIKEAFRLHPPAPLLFPRSAEEDSEIGGYFIPKDTRIVFNAWAMGRDPSIWPNPESFEPERFLDKNIDYKGYHFELIPFGSGRRICPGIQLAHRMLHSVVAALIGNFDWEVGAGEEERNGEKFGGVALQREAPLMAFAVKP